MQASIWQDRECERIMSTMLYSMPVQTAALSRKHTSQRLPPLPRHPPPPNLPAHLIHRHRSIHLHPQHRLHIQLLIHPRQNLKHPQPRRTSTSRNPLSTDDTRRRIGSDDCGRCSGAESERRGSLDKVRRADLTRRRCGDGSVVRAIAIARVVESGGEEPRNVFGGRCLVAAR